MMKYEQGAVHLDLLYLRVRQGRGNHGLAVGFATDIANMSLDNFAIDPEILYFCEIDLVTTFNPANKLIVYILNTTLTEKQVPFLVPQASESIGYIRVSSGFGKNADGVVYKKRGRIQVIGR
jgi:hypothetical protein